MKILVAPDSFKGSMRAITICKLFEQQCKTRGIAATSIPLADGGEGSLEAIAYASNYKKIELEVSGPDFGRVNSYYLFDEQNKTAYVELAEASGLELIDTQKISCMDTTTLGTGALIANALRQGAQKVVLFIGGSATNDGAMGIAAALGYRFLDVAGKELTPIGRNLTQLHHIEAPASLPQAEFLIACDVNNPLHGPTGAAHVYAKQKGASPEDIEELDKGLQRLNELVKQQFKLDLQHLAGAGAAGGVGGGMAAFFKAKLTPGTQLVFKATQLDEKIKEADVLVTGEGKTDDQTLNGKLVAQVLALSHAHTKKLLLCGFFDGDEALKKSLTIDAVFALAPTKADIPRAIEQVDVVLAERIADLLDSLPTT